MSDLPENVSPLRLPRRQTEARTVLEDDGKPMSLQAIRERVMTMPDEKFIVPGYIREGVTLLIGAPKTGKSFLALDFAYAVATGTEAMGGPICDKGQVFYVAAEDTEREIIKRAESRESDIREWPDERDLKIRPMPVEFAPAMANEWLTTATDPRLVIFDTMALCIPEVSDRGGYQADVARIKAVQVWAAKHALAVIIVHHTNKTRQEDGDDWMDKTSGTRGLTGTADAVLLLEGEPDGTGRLRGRGRSFEEFDSTLHRIGPWWHLFDTSNGSSLGDRSMQLVEYVSKQAAPVSVIDVSTGLDLPARTIRTYLNRLVASGRLSRPSAGRYWKAEQ